MSTADNLVVFNDLDCLPVKLKLNCLNDDDGVEQTLIRRKEKFHKTCRLQFNKTELRRADK